MATSSSTVKYSATTGKALQAGEKTTDAKGNTYTQGQSFSTPSSSSGSSKSSSGLSPADVSAGYSTTPGPYDAKTGKLKTGSNLTDPSAGAAVSNPVDPTLAKVDPSQPNPTKVNAGAGLPGSATPPLNIELSPEQQNTYDAAVNKYKAGWEKTTAAGTPVDSTMGGALKTVQDTVPKDKPASNVMPQIIDTEPGFVKSILEANDEYNSPENKRKSYVEEYKSMFGELGINGINEKLLNIDNIINGTEDSIRQEVQATGGFATDSQVLALAQARNKQNIKDYNNLLETKKFAMQQLDTMMQLSMEDRRAAEADFDRKMNFAFKVQEFTEKAKNNATEAYNNVIKNVGYAGLYSSLQQDPSSVALVEKTLGLSLGGLSQLAGYTPPASEMDTLQLENQRLQNKKLRNDIIRNDINGVDEKTQAKIQASPEYKTINGVLPALQALRSYKNAVEKYGTSELLNGTGKGELAGTYGNAIAAWKSLAGLGALSGADFALAENAVPSTGFFQRSSTMKGKLDASIQNAITQAETLTRRLQQNFPAAQDNLQRQLDEAKVIANPEKFRMGGDGNVYELTN